MPDQILFATRQDFRDWLVKNCATSEGIWLVFGKRGGPQTVTYDEALEEALCFGWIDSQVKRLDDKTYMQHFSPRRKGSNWSEINKALVASLEERGLMTDCGRAKINEAKANGKWNAPPPQKIADEQVALLTEVLQGQEPAYTNFLAMSSAVKRTYTALYLDAKTEQTKSTRLVKIIDRLNKNLKPM